MTEIGKNWELVMDRAIFRATVYDVGGIGVE